MRKPLAVGAFAAIVGLLATTYAPAGTATSAATHGSSAGATQRPPGLKPYESGKINPHLTAGECALLGGEVSDWDICLSGQVCHTRDETGYDHYVCLSKSA